MEKGPEQQTTEPEAAGPGDAQPAAQPAPGPGGTEILATLAVLLVIAAAVGGYLLGRTSGDDLPGARGEASSLGRQAGFRAGSSEGYALGLAAVDPAEAQAAYDAAYRAAYARAFEEKGLYPPAQASIPVAGAP